MDSSNNSPDPTPSFAFRSTTQSNNNIILRSHSTKETPFFSNLLHYSPSRLSCPTLSRSLQSSPLSSPLHHAAHYNFPTKLSADSDSDPQTCTYHCASSALRNDGQILCIALSSNGLVYTGSDSNLVRVWKLPEFTECGQLRTKASRVVALEVSNDTVYAAYGDGKIRVWTRTWDNNKVLRHVRLATIPKTVGYVRSYIAGKDKAVSICYC